MRKQNCSQFVLLVKQCSLSDALVLEILIQIYRGVVIVLTKGSFYKMLDLVYLLYLLKFFEEF